MPSSSILTRGTGSHRHIGMDVPKLAMPVLSSVAVARSYQSFYAHSFPTTEINCSFYRLPSGGLFEKWAAVAPDHFTFSVKANRIISRVQQLVGADEPWCMLLTNATRLQSHLGPILLQLPPTNMLNLLRSLPKLRRLFATILTLLLLPNILLAATRALQWETSPNRIPVLHAVILKCGAPIRCLLAEASALHRLAGLFRPTHPFHLMP